MKRLLLLCLLLSAFVSPLHAVCPIVQQDELAEPVTIASGECNIFQILSRNPRRLMTVETRPDSATGTLTATVNFGDGEAVVVGDETYTFETGALDAAGKVDVKGTLALSLQALEDAMMGTGTPGTDYHADTVASTSVTANATATTLVVTALIPGSNANTVATTETAAAAAWGGATLVDVPDPIVTVSRVDTRTATEHTYFTNVTTDDTPAFRQDSVGWTLYLISCAGGGGDCVVAFVP